MNNKEIDKLIKDRLSESPVSNHTADWHVFSQLLKKAEGFEDFDTDKSIVEKLSTHKVAYNDNHWQLLKERLVKEENIRKKLFTSKAIESILLLLLLLLFQNYDKNIFEQKISSDLKEAVAAANEINSGVSNHNASTIMKDAQTESELANPSLTLTSDILAFAHSVEAYTNTTNTGPVVNLDKTKVNELNADLELASYTPTRQVDDVVFLPVKSTHQRLFPINTAEQAMTSTEAPFALSPINLTGDVLNVGSKKQKFLTASVSGGLGIAKSGYDPIYKINGYSTYSSQYGIGLLYSVKNKSYEVQTGLRYSKKKYEPNKLTEVYGNLYSGYREISLDKISYDIVDVPVSVKYFLKDGKKTSFFLKAGVNASFSLANKYTVATSINQSNDIAASQVLVTDSKQIDKLSKLSQKEFIPGLLQPGKSHGVFTTIGENSFFTLSAEIGAETKITKDDALVLGMEYNKYYKVDGIGPNKDKLSALTINFGLKHSIN